jgi:hypothetical protein
MLDATDAKIAFAELIERLERAESECEALRKIAVVSLKQSSDNLQIISEMTAPVDSCKT